jgi:hypothetical protein
VGARFFTHVQTSPGAHPASCTVGTRSFPGVKQPGPVLTTHPLLVQRSRKSRAISLPPLWAFGSVTGYLYLLHRVQMTLKTQKWKHARQYGTGYQCMLLVFSSLPYSTEHCFTLYLYSFYKSNKQTDQPQHTVCSI